MTDKDNRPARSVLEGLDEALSAFAADAPLTEAGAPLMRAVEAALPDAKAALFETRAGEAPVLIAAPSLAVAEATRLGAVLREALENPAAAETPKAPVIAASPFGDGEGALVFEPVVVSDTHVVGHLGLVTPRPASADDLAHLRRCARIAGLMIEDRERLQELGERETLLGRLIDTSPDAVIRIASDGAIVGFSAAAEKMFGHRAEEVLGRDVTVLMTEEHAPRHAGYLKRYLETGERRLPNFGRRLEARRKDDSLFPVEIALAEFEDHGALQFVGIVRDVSFRVDAERRVDALREALARASQLSVLGEMAATVAHEVNQPLAAAASYLDAAALELETGDAAGVERTRALIAKAAAQSRLGGEIIKRLRRLTEHRQPALETEDLNEVAREAADVLADVARGAGVRFEQRYAPDLPDVAIDRVQIQQVISNLVRNAFDAVAERRLKRVTLTTRRVAEDGGAEIEVADSGPGVPEDMRAQIFESFISGREGGIGLGLAISRSIVEAHGGRIWVEDAEGGGAAFRVRLPET